jgi:hypothetical protein
MSDTNFSTLHKVPLAPLSAGTLTPQALTALRSVPVTAGTVPVCAITGTGDLHLDALTVQASSVSRVTLRHVQANGVVREAFTEQLTVAAGEVTATFPHPLTFTLGMGDQLDLILTCPQDGTILAFEDTFSVALLDHAQEATAFTAHATQVPALPRVVLRADAQNSGVAGELPLERLELGETLRPLPDAVGGLRGRVEALEPLKGTVEGLTGRLEVLEGLPGVDVTLPARVEALESLPQAVQALTVEVEALGGLPADVDDLETRVELLESLPGELSNLAQRLDSVSGLPDSGSALPGQVLTRTVSGLGWAEPVAPQVRLSEVVPQNVDVTGALSSWGTDNKYTFRLRAVAPLSIASLQIPRMMYDGSVGSTLYLLDDQGVTLASGTVFRVNDGVEQANLNRTVSIGAGQVFRVRLDTPLHARSTAVSALPFTSPDGLVEVLGTTTGLPYAPPVKFLAGPTLPKTVQGPLDPADLPGYAGAVQGQLLRRGTGGVEWVDVNVTPPPAVLGSGETLLDGTPALNFSSRMNSNTYGTTLSLRFEAVQDFTFRTLRLPLRYYLYPGTATIEAHRTGSNYETSAQTLVASAQVVLTKTVQTLDVLLNAEVNIPAGQYLVLKFIPQANDLVELSTNNEGRTLPYTLMNGLLKFTGGNAEDMSMVGNRIPQVSFLAALVKNVLGQLDPRDLKGFGDAAPGQVLMKDASGAPVWGAGGAGGQSSAVALSTITSGGFITSARDTGTNNYRMAGPILPTANITRTYGEVRVPIRNAVTKAGVTVRLNHINATSGLVLRSREVTLVGNEVELVFPGPFTVPANESHAFLVGAVQGGWGEHLTLFYGGQTGGYPAPQAHVSTLLTDVVPATSEGETLTGLTGAVFNQYRVVNLMAGATIPKGVIGPLDPADLPGYAEAAVGKALVKTPTGIGWADAGGGGTTDLETIVAALRAPQMVDGLVYATSDLNYDSQRDGWGEIAPHTYNQQTRYTDYYHLGTMGELFTGSGGANGAGVSNVRRTSAITSTDGPQLAAGDVASITVTVLETVPCLGLYLEVPGGSNSGATLTYNVRVLKDGNEIFTKDLTKTGTGYVYTVPMPDVPFWTPGAYTVEYRVVAASDPALRAVKIDQTTSPANGIRVPFATEDFLLYVNGTPVGVNGMLAMSTEWKNSALAVPQTVTVDGPDLIVQGSGLALRRTAAAPLPRTLNGPKHRAIIEFTPEPVSGAHHYRFSVGMLEATPTIPADFRGLSPLSLQVNRGTYGGATPASGDTLPVGTILRGGNSPFQNLSSNSFSTAKRLRLEVSVQFEAFQNFYGVNIQEFRPSIKLFDAETGATLYDTQNARNDLTFPYGAISPSLYVAAYAGFVADQLPSWVIPNDAATYGWTTQNQGAWGVVPVGTEQPARVRVHRWIEWRE